MCTVCGCDTKGAATIEGHASHVHDHHGHTHDHDGALHYGHGQAGLHVPGQSQERLIEIERDILGKNNQIAFHNREKLVEQSVIAVNLLSGPGSGKTTLLTETLKALKGQIPLAVIEGDQQTSNDADRIRATGVEALQINTGKGCHLDADMVAHALSHITVPQGGLLFIENVGNLVCPASFDLGEQARVVLASTTEGEDKPIKYPDMFATADIVLMTKSDLLPYLSFDVEAFEQSVRKVNADAPILSISSTAPGGLAPWLDWLADLHPSLEQAAE